LIGNPDATLFLSATFTSCGVIQTPQKNIRCGAYPNYYGVISGSTYVGLNKTYTYSVNNSQYPGVVPQSWSWPPNWTYLTGGGTNSYVVLRSPSTTNPPTGNIVLNAKSCNIPFVSSKFVVISSSYLITPNPAYDVINIQEKDDSTGQILPELNVQSIEISNRSGVIFYSQKTNSKGLRSLRVPIGYLKNDVYAIRIFNGYEWKSYKFIVVH
jgi:hypothetical protein